MTYDDFDDCYADNYCNSCGVEVYSNFDCVCCTMPLCDDCIRTYKGLTYCESCLEKIMSQQ